MQLPIKTHYATLAMLALAQRWQAGELVPARAIAEEHGVPSQFLGQILQQLRASGLITSTRGASGGFQLSRSPARITVADVLDAVCRSESVRTPAAGTSPLACVALDLWDDLARQQDQFLRELSLEELLSRVTESADTMFYI